MKKALVNKIIKLPKAILLAIVAIITGVISAISLATYIQDKIAQVESESRLNMVERIVAARDLPAGTKLISDHFAIRSFPADWVGSDTLPISSYENLPGKILTTNLKAGDPIVPAHILVSKSNLSNSLSPGRRAITLSVDVVNSLSGLLQPGDLIDLYVSFNYQRKNVTAPLLQGVMVLATGTDTLSGDYESNDNYSTITLDTAPEDAVKLVAARQAGKLTAILRNPADDTADSKAARGDLAALLGLSVKPPPAKKKAVVLYGGSRAFGIPSWVNGTSVPVTNGLFDMPNAQGLSSPWVNNQSAGNQFLNLDTYADDDLQSMGNLSNEQFVLNGQE